MIVVTNLDDPDFAAPLGLLRDLQPAIPGDLPEPKRVLVDQPECVRPTPGSQETPGLPRSAGLGRRRLDRR